MGYILSGAETPRRSSPLAKTWRVASLSHSRVRWRSVISSSAVMGRTRLWLNDATRQVLANGLDLLGVSAPERM